MNEKTNQQLKPTQTTKQQAKQNKTNQQQEDNITHKQITHK